MVTHTMHDDDDRHLLCVANAKKGKKKGKKKREGERRERRGRRDCKITQGRSKSNYLLPAAHRWRLPLPAAYHWRHRRLLLPAACRLPPTTGAYCCLPLAPTRAAYYAFRLRSSDACTTLTRAELSWSKRCCRLCVGPLERGWEENGLWRGGGRMRRSATLLLEASS